MAYVSVPRAMRTNPFGDSDAGLGLAPLAIVAPIAGGVIHASSTPKSNADTDHAYNTVVVGDRGAAAALAFLVQQGGFTSNGGWHGAVGIGADRYAREKLGQLVNAGLVIGPTVDPQHWYTNPNGWRLAGAAANAVNTPTVNPIANIFGDSGANRVLAVPPGSAPAPDLLSNLAGGSSLTTLALIGLGAFVLSKVVK